MTVGTSSGWKAYIAPVDTAADTEAEYGALVWTEIKEVSDLGEFGGQSNDVTFSSLSDNIVRHMKGVRDNGVIALVVGRDPLDAGQVACRAAEKTKFQYPFKIVATDAPDEDHTDSIFYFQAIVQSARVGVGGSDSVVTDTFNLGTVTSILEVPAEAIP